MKINWRFPNARLCLALILTVGIGFQAGGPGVTTAYALQATDAPAAGEDFEQDPWEPFNEKMFWFNKNVADRFILKPIATGWDFLLPDPVQTGIHNAIDNLSVVRRLVNNLLQLKFGGAGREVARFTINSTVGVAGLFDVGKAMGIDPSDEDTGQTMGVYGIGPGPYLVLPFLPPMTVRDGIGFAADGAMNPMNYFIPFYATLGIGATNVVNERSLNLDRFERVEETTIDLYGAVRNAYLQRRAAAIRE
jgi:phospholipid-binding lipoprotein MlaA